MNNEQKCPHTSARTHIVLHAPTHSHTHTHILLLLAAALHFQTGTAPLAYIRQAICLFRGSLILIIPLNNDEARELVATAMVSHRDGSNLNLLDVVRFLNFL